MKIKFMKRLGGSVSTRHGKTLLRSLPLMAAGLLACTLSTRAADSPGVKFNSGVRYSQWAIDSRANDFYANATAFGLAKYNLDGSVATARKDTKKKLDYVPGIVSKAMIEAADYYNSFDWSKPWFLSVKEYGDAYDAKVPETGDSFDNLNGAKLYIGLYNNKYATDADKSMVKTALASVKKGFIAANTSYVIPTGTLAEKAGYTVAGGWWHKSIYENQMWLDGAYMGSALLAQLTQFYGSSDNVFGSKTADWDMVTKQLDIVWNLCWNSTDKLMYHAFDATASAKAKDGNSNTWAGLSSTTPYVFHSAAYWGRADAWYLYALVDVLEAMKADGQESTSNYTKLKSHLEELAAGIAARQDKTTGGWYQLLDKDATYVSTKYNGSSKNDANYIETSATSLFSAAFFKAVRLGLLADSYKDVAANAFKGLVNNFVTYDNGTIQIWGSSKSAGLGGSSYRDGSNEYYLSGGDVTMVKKGETTEGKVLGGFIMAATEYERAYQNQDSKQILFAKDLAPTYDFSTTEGALDATAYGNGTVSYQWYKDGSPIADATSATYTPTESGTYKCTATANGTTTITTSEAVVTAKSASSGEKETPKAVTFPVDQLKTLDSNPGSGEVSSLTIEAITIKAGSGISANKNALKISKNNGSDFTISANGAKITKITFVTNSSSKNLTSDPQTKPTADGLTWTYDFSTSKPSSIKFTNASSSNINVTEIQVEYESSTPSTPKTDLTATYAAQSIDATVGDVNLTAPELTVMAGETALTAEQYAVSYASSATDVVRVEEDGSLTAAHKGTATITATITPADGTKYNSTTATFTVNANARQLKASFSPAAVDAKEDDEARDLPTLSVIDVKTTQPVSDFTATYTSNNENVVKIVDNKLVFTGVGKTTIKATVTPTLQTVYDGCEATFEVSVAKKQSDIDPTKDNVVYDFLQNVGTEVAGVAQIKINEGENIMFGTNFKAAESKYLTVGADGDGGFKAGDVVTIKGYCSKKNSGILIYANPTDAEPQFQSPAFSATEVTYTFTVQKDCDKLYFGRFGGSSTYVTGLTIVRPGTTGEKTRLTAAFAKNSDVIINKTDNYTVDLPALTVMAGEEELAADQYSVVYSSNDEAIASVANGKITVKTTGTATILATVTPTDANNYEGCTATYTITVKEQTPLNISVNDVNINVTDANYKQPIIKVYGDDDKLLTLGTDYTLSYSVEGTNVSVENGMLKVAGEKYKWTEGTSTITVTATPTPSLGETFKAGTMTFLYNVVKGKLTPTFLASFTTTGEAIKIKKYDSKTNKNNKTFRVPLIYDGEDVSEYFKYTYKVTDTNGNEVTNKNNKTNGNEFTFRPDNEGDFTISVSATPTTKDNDDYSEVYNTPASISFKVNVSASYIRPVITFNPETVQMYTGTAEGAPDVIVTDGTNELEEGTAYSLKWISFTPSFVKVDEKNGKLEAVNEGNGSVRVTVKGENLETMTAFLTVYVDDPAVYRAKDKDNDGVAVAYGNQKQMWNQDRTMSVTLGGWMFPNDVTEGLKYDSNEGLSKKYKWADKASQPKWKMSGFNRFVSGESSKNARQEDGSNALVNTTMISTADFKTKGEVVDRMFNVPCSGSYLVFNPATNGTVNVHIFQNGAFDSGVYRPQRRVFVMDEQGNFVQSTPEIENANGKPTGGLKALSNFKWDINPNGANTDPSIEQVRSHFKGIPADFDMTEEKFQNNVLESNLSADIVPNAAYKEDVEGSNGWCVLADSPVTYTFKVKAGKTYYLWNFGSKIGFYGFSFEEDATKPEIDDVTYDETATDNQIVSTPAGHMAKVSINRHIKQGIWNACVLPFSLNKHQVDALFGDTYMMGCENGTQILYFDHVDANGKVWFVRHAYNTIVANKPFLIKPTKDVETINTADCADYPYVTIEAPEGNKPADWCSDGKYAWVSSYNSDMTLAEGDGYIGGTSGSFIQSTKNDVKVKGFRGYLKGLTPEAKAHALSTATRSNTEENGSTTFIEGLTIDAEGNIVPVATDGKVYNINGQVVADGMKNLNALPSGVYIINGKKYVK